MTADAKLQFPKRPTHKEDFMDFGIQPNPLGPTTGPDPGRGKKTSREGVPVDGVGRTGGFLRLSSAVTAQSTLWPLRGRAPSLPTLQPTGLAENMSVNSVTASVPPLSASLLSPREMARHPSQSCGQMYSKNFSSGVGTRRQEGKKFTYIVSGSAFPQT